MQSVRCASTGPKANNITIRTVFRAVEGSEDSWLLVSAAKLHLEAIEGGVSLGSKEWKTGYV